MSGSRMTLSGSSFGGGGHRTRSAQPQMSLFKGATKSMGRKKKKCRKSNKRSSSQSIGFTTGGAQDVNSFRDNVMKNGRVPQLKSLSFEGIFADYYFETEENEIGNEVDNEDEDDKKEEGVEEELPLFYPSYTYSKSLIPRSLQLPKTNNTDMIAADENDTATCSGEFDYFLTVGLNSNISESDFERKPLNLICVLDVSGSMGSSFGGNSNKSKMKIANEALLSVLCNLRSDDRFGLVCFDSSAWQQIAFKEMKEHKLNELESILDFYENGGTNFESGYRAATKMFKEAEKKSGDYTNRIIFLTDACPNIGSTDPDSLMSMVRKSAMSDSLFTTFVGVGLDFNSTLISEISKVRGANYFSVHSSADFYQKLSAEFDYFVFAMVFDLCLTLQSEGNEVCIADVYGSNDIDATSGEIMNIQTLFPSPPDPDTGAVKGGIVLIKLKQRKVANYSHLEIICSFEDRTGKKYKNKQELCLNEKDESEFYANLGNRKGILLTRYVVLLKQWLKECGQGSQVKATSDGFKQKLIGFCKYFEREMDAIGDKTLKSKQQAMDSSKS